MLWDLKPNTHMLWRRRSAAWEREIPSLHCGIYPGRVSDRDQRFSAHGLEGRNVCILFNAYARDLKVRRSPRRSTPFQCLSCKKQWLSRHDYVPPACSCDISIGFSDLAHFSEGNPHRLDLSHASHGFPKILKNLSWSNKWWYFAANLETVPLRKKGGDRLALRA